MTVDLTQKKAWLDSEPKEAWQLVIEDCKTINARPRSTLSSRKLEGKLVGFLTQDQSQSIDQFSLRWSTMVKFDRSALPTMDEVVGGLRDFLLNKVEVSALWKKKSKDQVQQIKKNIQTAFEIIG